MTRRNSCRQNNQEKYTDSFWPLFVLVKIYVGILIHPLRTNLKRTGSKKAQHQCWCGSQQWNVIDTAEIFKIHWAGGRTPHEKRRSAPYDSPIWPYGAQILCKPISQKDISRLHQCHKKLPDMFMVCAPHTGRWIDKRLAHHRF